MLVDDCNPFDTMQTLNMFSLLLFPLSDARLTFSRAVEMDKLQSAPADCS